MRALLASVFLSVALGAAAPAEQASGDGADQKPADKKVRLICKREAELGTHMAKRVCKSWEQWRQEDAASSAASQRFVDRMSEQSSAASAGALSSGK